MIVALSLLVLGLVAILVISSQIERAPIGFEDERGFHFSGSETRAPSKTVSVPIGIAGKVVG